MGRIGLALRVDTVDLFDFFIIGEQGAENLGGDKELIPANYIDGGRHIDLRLARFGLA